MGATNGKYDLNSGDLRHLSNHSGMSEDHIKLQFKQFCEKYPDGKIPKEAYGSILRVCYRQKDVSNLVDYISNAYDLNNDGFVDFKEMMIVIYTFSTGTPREKLIRIFQIFDLDHDGFIKKEEVVKITKDLYTLLGK